MYAWKVTTVEPSNVDTLHAWGPGKVHVLAYESIHSVLRPTVVSVDHISGCALTVDHIVFSGFVTVDH